MLTTQAITINGSNNKPISIDICFKNDNLVKPVVLFFHGFKGFKNWGHFDWIAQHFAEHDFVFVKFNFSHNGTTPEQPLDFVDLEAFGNNNFSIELDDAGFVIDYIEAHAAEFQADSTQLFLIGHSRGGGIAILKSNEDNRIKKLTTWASIKDIADFISGQDIEVWKTNGKIFTYNSRTLQNMPLHYQLYENYIKNKSRLDIPNAAASLHIPWLIVHGTNDTSVPVEAAEFLHARNPHNEILIIKDGDHTFGGKHPWKESNLPDDALYVCNKTISFFRPAIL